LERKRIQYRDTVVPLSTDLYFSCALYITAEFFSAVREATITATSQENIIVEIVEVWLIKGNLFPVKPVGYAGHTTQHSVKLILAVPNRCKKMLPTITKKNIVKSNFWDIEEINLKGRLSMNLKHKS